jgi:hypothetical protein
MESCGRARGAGVRLAAATRLSRTTSVSPGQRRVSAARIMAISKGRRRPPGPAWNACFGTRSLLSRLLRMRAPHWNSIRKHRADLLHVRPESSLSAAAATTPTPPRRTPRPYPPAPPLAAPVGLRVGLVDLVALPASPLPGVSPASLDPEQEPGQPESGASKRCAARAFLGVCAAGSNPLGRWRSWFLRVWKSVGYSVWGGWRCPELRLCRVGGVVCAR